MAAGDGSGEEGECSVGCGKVFLLGFGGAAIGQGIYLQAIDLARCSDRLLDTNVRQETAHEQIGNLVFLQKIAKAGTLERVETGAVCEDDVLLLLCDALGESGGPAVLDEKAFEFTVRVGIPVAWFEMFAIRNLNGGVEDDSASLAEGRNVCARARFS